MGVLTIPSARLNQNKTPMLSAIDGQILLNNGKSTVASLKRMMEELANAEEEVEWSEGELARVFKEGLRVDEVRYVSDEELANVEEEVEWSEVELARVFK